MKEIIEKAFESMHELADAPNLTTIKEAVDETLHQLDTGALRIAAPSAAGWIVNCLLYTSPSPRDRG